MEPGAHRIIVLVAGMPGSGKSIVSSIAKEMGIPVFVMGDVVREEAARRGLEPTPSNLNMVAKKLREEYGPTVVAERTAEKIRRTNNSVVLVDGVRSLDEVNVFRRYGEVIIVAVHASPRTRFERIRRRGRPGDPKTWEDFVARDLTELGFGLGNVIALADHMLVNEEKSIEEFRTEAKKLLDKLLS
ncbi:dephospho-CoA kinase [Pyrofollis japonicus]|nr:AAA family ATPase [Pyrofollis japonicus]BEP17794.1 dephospho-CoA kinase [Pyrofollis japonicus]